VSSADLRGDEVAFAISRDAKTVLFQPYEHESMLRFQLNASIRNHEVPRLEQVEGPAPGEDLVDPTKLRRGHIEDVGDVETWVQPLKVKRPIFFGKDVLQLPGLDMDDISRNVVVLQTADLRPFLDKPRRILLWGTEFALRLLDDQLEQICKPLPITSPAYRVNITTDGSIAVVAHGDGTIRWYRLRDARERKYATDCQFKLLLTLYVYEYAPRKWSWIAWTTDGHHFASAVSDVRGVAGWQNSSGNFSAPEDAGNFSDLFSAQGVASALDVAQAPSGFDEKLKNRQPDFKVEIVEPADKIANSDNLNLTFRVSYDEQKQRRFFLKAGITTSTGRIGNPETSLDGINSPQGAKLLFSGGTANLHTLSVKVPNIAKTKKDGSFIVTLSVSPEENDQNYVVQSSQFTWSAPGLGSRPKRISAVIVGISNNDDERYTLRYANKDAYDFTRLWLKLFELGRGQEPVDIAELKIQLLVTEVSAFDAAMIATLKADAKALGVQLETVNLMEAGTDHPAGEIVLPAREKILIALKKSYLSAGQPAGDSSDRFVFFYSGHGAAVKSTDWQTVFLMPQGVIPREFSQMMKPEFRKSLLGLNEFVEPLSLMPYEKLLILDNCLIPLFGQEKLVSSDYVTDGARAPITSLNTKSSDSIAVFTASRPGKESFEQNTHSYDRINSKLYSYEEQKLVEKYNVRGNGIFSLAVLMGMSCPEAAQPFHKDIITPQTTSVFIRDFFSSQSDNQYLADLRMSQDLVPYSNVNAEFSAWARVDPGLTRCVVGRSSRP
jgi:hypothetical protein